MTMSVLSEMNKTSILWWEKRGPKPRQLDVEVTRPNRPKMRPVMVYMVFLYTVLVYMVFLYTVLVYMVLLYMVLHYTVLLYDDDNDDEAFKCVDDDDVDNDENGQRCVWS